MKQPPKYISTILLTVFLWSCFGIGAGMMGHSVMLNMGEEMISSDSHAHECCAIDQSTPNTSETNTVFVDHHRMDPIALTKMMAFLFVVFSSFATTLLSVYFIPSVTIRGALYQHRWEQRISFFALHIQKLFRIGILHPKSW